MQNTSHAVMAQRVEPKDSADDFPTPPWATRALVEHVLDDKDELRAMSCLEPACGAGHMAKVLKEYFGEVHAFDAYHYGYGPIRDFLVYPYETNWVDWVITNPPFRHAKEFVLRALPIARRGVAILARTVFLESVGRYKAIFHDHPPSKFAPFVERVPCKGAFGSKGVYGHELRLVRMGEDAALSTRVVWVPPCRRQLERRDDY